MDVKPVLDLSNLRSITGGDALVEGQIFQMFHSVAQSSLAQLESLLGQPSASEWNDLVHSLKGAAANIGALALSHCCKLAEQSVTREQREESLRHIATAYEALKQQLLK